LVKRNIEKFLIVTGLIGITMAAGIANDSLTISNNELANKYQNAPKQIKDKYTVENASFVREVKADPKDRMLIKIGGKNSFEPKIKIDKWDEVGFSIKLKNNQLVMPSISFEDDKIKWEKGDKKIEFYEVEADEENQDGAYKFVWYLDKKPKSNIVDFEIISDGVDFLYQPPLTQEEIDEGAFRPDRVIGSYAVYASEKKVNWVGGKEYKAGKVGHIYRPKIIDANGDWVWGNLHIENGIYSVEIPQEFLDEAVYPIKANDTFGYTTKGSSNYELDQNYAVASKFTSPAGDNEASKLTIATAGDNNNCKGVIWLVSDGSVQKVGAAFLDSSDDWHDSTFSTNFSLSASTNYYLGGVSDGYPLYIYMDSGDIDQLAIDFSNSYSSPTTHSVDSKDDYKLSVYATYTSSGGGGSNDVWQWTTFPQ